MTTTTTDNNHNDVDNDGTTSNAMNIIKSI